jgi:hypothetical protein
MPFHYEHQEDHLCAKHAINNVMAILHYATVEDLDAIVASSRNTRFVSLEQGRYKGYVTSTVSDFFETQGVTYRILRNRTMHVLPKNGNEWHARLGHSIGLICFVAPLQIASGVPVHTVGHFFAVVLIVRTNTSYYRTIDSLDNGKVRHFPTSDSLSQYLRLKNILEVVQVISTDQPNGKAGDHPDMPHHQLLP